MAVAPVAPMPTNPLQLSGGAGGNAGPSEAGGHLSNPFASGEMNIAYGGGNASGGFTVAPWMVLAVIGAGVFLWTRSKS